MATVKGIGEHQDVKNAYLHYANRNFAVSKEAIYAFWANDVERDEQGKFIAHHGKETALKFQLHSQNENKIPVYLMENFEGKNSVLVLNDYEKKTDVSHFVVAAVCAFASASYAKSASDTILTSVKGAAINSFFRTNELPIIMTNPNINKLINISRDDPEGTIYSKKEAYHVLRNEWLDSTMKEFEQVAQDFKGQKIPQEKYDSELSKMAAETILSVKACNKIKAEFNVITEYQNYDMSDIAKELNRLNKCKRIISKYPELKTEIQKLSRNDKTVNEKVLGYLNNNIGKVINKAPITPLPSISRTQKLEKSNQI